MSIQFGDILKHNNLVYPIVDINDVKGGLRSIATFSSPALVSEFTSIPEKYRSGYSLLLETSTGTLYYLAGTDATNVANWSIVNDGYIPLSGTEVGKPVTGDIEMQDFTNIKSFSPSVNIDTRIEFDQGALKFKIINNISSYTKSFIFRTTDFSLEDTNPDSKGIVGNTLFNKQNDPNAFAQMGDLASLPLPTLQQILDNNRELIDGNNFQGTNAGDNNTGNKVNANGQDSALNNTGDNINAFGLIAASNNSGNNVNAIGESSANSNTGDNINAFGVSSAEANTGENVNANGFQSANNNTGDDVNAFGLRSTRNNTGSNVNAFGFGSAESNSFSNVNLFGYSSNADADNQTVFSKNNADQAVISFANITGRKKFELPNAEGTFALLGDLQGSNTFATSSITMTSTISNNFYGKTVSGELDFTLPPIAGNEGKIIIVANKSISGNIIIRSNAGGNDIWSGGGSFSTFPIAPNYVTSLRNDGVNWTTFN